MTSYGSQSPDSVGPRSISSSNTPLALCRGMGKPNNTLDLDYPLE